MNEPNLQVDFGRYPFLTAGLASPGGRIKESPDDFCVDEIRDLAADETGAHLHLLIRKRGWNTKAVVDWLGKQLELPDGEIGWAGLKDRHAVTTQWLSIPITAQNKLEHLNWPDGIWLEAQMRHTHKLQEGHLNSNRFRILLRGATDAVAAQQIMEKLAEQGVPNFYGPQRFGREGKNPYFGYRLIARGRGRSKNWKDKFQINALQSLLFNDWLAARMKRGLYRTLMPGDVAHKFVTGGKFLVSPEELTQAQLRAEQNEICATGPLFGRKYHEAQFDARTLEDEVLRERGLTREHFVGSPGSRRPARWPLSHWQVEPTDVGLWLTFTLPRGAYATAVLRELMRTEFTDEATD